MREDTWLDAARDSFEEALSSKEWGIAKCVIADTMDRGLMEEARSMNKQLREEMDKQSTFAEKYILAFLKKKNDQFKKMGLIPTVDMVINDLEGKGPNLMEVEGHFAGGDASGLIGKFLGQNDEKY